MMGPVELEQQYQDIIYHLEELNPEGIIHVDLELLQSLGLLDEEEQQEDKPPVTHYFHVIETSDKITLFNDQFVVWIVPQVIDAEPLTVAFVGLLTTEGVHLELVFATSGVYNTSKMVLQVLERYLEEIQENEEVLSHLNQE